MGRLIIWLVRGYQTHISPYLGNNCRFTPSCSQYMIEAVEIHGALKGLALGIWRLLRCNPWGKCGQDPVPEKDHRLGR
jgi:putative membrane protein insertion efficiency factor